MVKLPTCSKWSNEMNDIKFFKKNNNEPFMSIQSAIVPPIGGCVWIDGGSEFYTVKSVLYNVCTTRKRLIIEIIVE